jgi:hypothetical protein
MQAHAAYQQLHMELLLLLQGTPARAVVSLLT